MSNSILIFSFLLTIVSVGTYCQKITTGNSGDFSCTPTNTMSEDHHHDAFSGDLKKKVATLDPKDVPGFLGATLTAQLATYDKQESE